MAAEGPDTGERWLQGSLPRPVQAGVVIGLALIAVAAALLGPSIDHGEVAGSAGLGPSASLPGTATVPGAPGAPGSNAVLAGATTPVDTGNPATNRPAPRNFFTACSGTRYDNSVPCTSVALAAIDAGRAGEGLGAMVLPSNWYRLGPEEQLFVATNLERTARNLPPLSGTTAVLDRASAAGVRSSTDPEPPTTLDVGTWGANWAGALGNALQVVYLWMYDDGVGSANVDCHRASDQGCWGHRENVLLPLSCATCLMGVASEPSGYRGTPGWAEILADVPATTPVALSWAAITPQLPADEAGR